MPVNGQSMSLINNSCYDVIRKDCNWSVADGEGIVHWDEEMNWLLRNEGFLRAI